MSKANLVEKVVKMSLGEIIKFQLDTHCHLRNIQLSDADTNCLTLLGLLEEADLSEFCALVATKEIFKTTQTVRNCLTRMDKFGLIVKDGPSKKRLIKINPELNIQMKGSILLIYKIVYINATD